MTTETNGNTEREREDGRMREDTTRADMAGRHTRAQSGNGEKKETEREGKWEKGHSSRGRRFGTLDEDRKRR